MSEYLVPGLDGWSYTADPSATSAAPNAGPRSGQKHAYPAQAGNTVAGNTANQAIGTFAAPALASGAAGTVTWSDSLINATSIIRVVGVRQGTTTPAAGAFCLVTWWEAPGSGSVIVHCYNPGSAATLATDFQVVAEVLATSAG